MKHLALDERLALIEAPAEPDHPHLAACARCRSVVTAARVALNDARHATVPEPSPLFWDHFSKRVSEGIAAPAAPVANQWAPWRVLVPLAVGVAALVMVVAFDRGPVTRPTTPSMTAPIEEDGGAAGVGGDEEEWRMLAHLAADFDVETLSDSLGKSGASVAESVVWQLSEQERAELAALLRVELRQGTSGS